jgi:hypothetical protein
VNQVEGRKRISYVSGYVSVGAYSALREKARYRAKKCLEESQVWIVRFENPVEGRMAHAY